jgi:hypothetical protein
MPSTRGERERERGESSKAVRSGPIGVLEQKGYLQVVEERGSSGGGKATATCRMWTQLPRSRWIEELTASQQETKTTCGAGGREERERKGREGEEREASSE